MRVYLCKHKGAVVWLAKFDVGLLYNTSQLGLKLVSYTNTNLTPLSLLVVFWTLLFWVERKLDEKVI